MEMYLLVNDYVYIIITGIIGLWKRKSQSQALVSAKINS